MSLCKWVCLLALTISASANAGGGPIGIDHRLHYDNSGIWKISNQNIVVYGSLLTVVGGAVALGGDDRFGNTLWRSTDAFVLGELTTTVLKKGFRRQRPSETSDPDSFFSSGKKNDSFPSGHMTAMTAMVTPIIMEYHEDYPAVYALALLPAYMGVARLKVRAHWQSDVLAGAIVGTGFGIWAGRRDSPLILSWLPGGFQVGYIHHFK
ncbi:MAG: phosphatase PAP2 family protein [Luteibacter sp.]